MNTRQPPENWEETLDAELKLLPDLPAPDTLIPRVMAALAAEACLPWYRRTWWTWPLAARVLSVAVLSALWGSLAWVAWHTGDNHVLAGAGDQVGGWLAPFRPAWTVLNSVVNALALVLRQGGSWLLFGAVAFAVIMYLSCVGLGTVFYRVAIKNR